MAAININDSIFPDVFWLEVDTFEGEVNIELLWDYKSKGSINLTSKNVRKLIEALETKLSEIEKENV